MARTLGIVSTGNELENHLKANGEQSGSFDAVKLFNFSDMPRNLTDCMVHLCDLESAEKADPQVLAKFREANPGCRIVGYSGNETLRNKYAGVAEVYEPVPAYRLLEKGLPQAL